MNKLGNIDMDKFNWGQMRIWPGDMNYSLNGNDYPLGWCIELTNKKIGTYMAEALTLAVF